MFRHEKYGNHWEPVQLNHHYNPLFLQNQLFFPKNTMFPRCFSHRFQDLQRDQSVTALQLRQSEECCAALQLQQTQLREELTKAKAELPGGIRDGKSPELPGTLWWTNILQWKITIFDGKIHYKWPFSIAMLVHQRVNIEKNDGESPCYEWVNMGKPTISIGPCSIAMSVYQRVWDMTNEISGGTQPSKWG